VESRPAPVSPPPVAAAPALILASASDTPPVDTLPAPGAYIQLGAFGNPDNAEAFRSHMAREFDWIADRLRLEPGGKVMRVQDLSVIAPRPTPMPRKSATPPASSPPS
jgi:hypothetical protein